jgi:hypothetical protein
MTPQRLPTYLQSTQPFALRTLDNAQSNQVVRSTIEKLLEVSQHPLGLLAKFHAYSGDPLIRLVEREPGLAASIISDMRAMRDVINELRFGP